MTHPIQPLYKDEYGTVRFKSNQIVQYLLDAGPFDLNHLEDARMFSREDREQFAQLIGWSLDGFGNLSFTSDETYNQAERMSIDRVTDDTDSLIDMIEEQQRLISLLLESYKAKSEADKREMIATSSRILNKIIRYKEELNNDSN